MGPYYNNMLLFINNYRFDFYPSGQLQLKA